MKVRILRGFRDYTPGQVFEDWPGGMCEVLIGQGFIEAVVESASADSTNDALDAAEDDQKVEKAEMPRRRKAK